MATVDNEYDQTVVQEVMPVDSQDIVTSARCQPEACTDDNEPSNLCSLNDSTSPNSSSTRKSPRNLPFVKNYRRFLRFDDLVKIMQRKNVKTVQGTTPDSLNCFLCKKNLNDYKDYMAHMERYHQREKVICLMCNQVTENYIKHLEENHSVLRDKLVNDSTAVNLCLECGETFGSRIELKQHRSKHFDLPKRSPKQNLCERCGRKFVTPLKLAYHLSLSHSLENGVLKCSICEMMCKSKITLRTHFRNLHESSAKSKKFICEHCNKEFLYAQTLKTHVTVEHDENGKKVSCRVCDKKFPYKSLLNIHMASHREYRDFSCDECAMRFKHKHSLKNHISVKHSNCTSSYQCSTCGKLFKTRLYLDCHVKQVHDTEESEKVECEDCDKMFKTAKILQRHRKQCHNQDKRKHVCKECHKAFFSPKDLRRHLLSHEITKASFCGVCERTFKRADNLRQHIRKQHPDKDVNSVMNSC